MDAVISGAYRLVRAMLYVAAEVVMRTLAKALVLALVVGLAGAGTASAATHKTQARHGKKQHHRAVRHAKAKSKRSGTRHAASDALMTPHLVA